MGRRRGAVQPAGRLDRRDAGATDRDAVARHGGDGDGRDPLRRDQTEIHSVDVVTAASSSSSGATPSPGPAGTLR